MIIMGILEAGPTKQSDMKKFLERVSQKSEKTTRNQTICLSHQRDKHQGCPACKILRAILEVDEGRSSTNELENKKTHDDAWGLTSQRWHRQAVCV